MVLFCVAAAVYFLAICLWPRPVVMLASFVAVSHVASHASRRVVGQWGGAAQFVRIILRFCGEFFGLRGGFARLENPIGSTNAAARRKASYYNTRFASPL